MRYEVKNENGVITVIDTKSGAPITNAVPTIEIAQEIADDFNAMDSGDFDLSTLFPTDIDPNLN